MVYPKYGNPNNNLLVSKLIKLTKAIFPLATARIASRGDDENEK